MAKRTKSARIQERDLTEGPLSGHLRAMAGPAALGMLFNTLYNVVDTYFAGQISTSAQAGLSVSFAIFMVLMAVGFGLNQGAGALIGAALGARDKARARRVAVQALFAAAAGGLFLGILGMLISGPALRLIGAAPEVALLGESYLFFLFIALPAFLVGFAANGALTAQGDSRTNRTVQICAFGANIVLNPLLIWGIGGLPAFGFDGIALSTALIQTGVALYLSWRALGSQALSGAGMADLRPDPAIAGALFRQAAPASLTMIVMMVGMFLLNFHLQQFGPAAVAGYGVAFRVEQLILLPILAISFSLMPIVAQNYGAGDHGRVRQGITLAVVVALGLAVPGAVLLGLGGEVLVRLFTDDPAVAAAGATYLRLAAFMMPAYTAMFLISALFQGLQQPGWSVLIGIYRQPFALALYPWVAIHVLDLGLAGVWAGLFAAVWSGLLLALVLIMRVAGNALGSIRPDFTAFGIRPPA